MTANEMRKVMQEWLNGAPRQRWVNRPDGQSGWVDLPNDCTEWKWGVLYRIKPKEKVRKPLDASYFRLSGVWLRYPTSDTATPRFRTPRVSLVVGVSDEGVQLFDTDWTYQELMDSGMERSPNQIDWYPCWVEVDQ